MYCIMYYVFLYVHAVYQVSSITYEVLRLPGYKAYAWSVLGPQTWGW